MIRESLAYYVLAYAAGHEREPYVSPVFGDMEGLPKSLIFVGSDEILFDDAKWLAKKLNAGGVEVELVIGNGLRHVYPLYAAGRQKAVGRCRIILTELGLSETITGRSSESARKKTHNYR